MEMGTDLGSSELEVHDVAVDGPSHIFWSEEAAAIGVESDGQIVLFGVAIDGKLRVVQYERGQKNASGRRLGRPRRSAG